MRTTLMIDDELLRAALEATGLKTRSAVIEYGLKLLIKDKSSLKAGWEMIEQEGGVMLRRKHGRRE